MGLATIKRLAADIMKVGVNKVRIDPDNLAKASEALTRNDVRGLIQGGIVYRAPVEGRRRKKPKKNVFKGHGSRKGTKSARNPAKKSWMEHVRAQRRYLLQLVSEGSVKQENKRNVYMKIKSGIFKSKKTMHAYLKENNLLVEKKG